ncbi:MAG: STAS domain-containing protein [Alphaproteobacteria bacterium]|nr:STAS domain-containing protein [Alphaproteobacteria bacterium]MBO4644428.1 STAS domain-containing protein [Alphaproteobacteria bacterium]
MELKKLQENGITVLKVAGQLTSSTSPALEKAINEILETEKNLILDFAELEFLASSGIRVILSTQKKINSKNGALVIRNVKKVVMDVFEMTGLREFLNVFSGNRQILGLE